MTALFFFYHLAWTCLAILSLSLIPFIKRWRVLDRLHITLPPASPKRGSIWIHALSVGEVISALPLVRAVRQKYPWKDIVFTVTTAQGMEIARNELRGAVKVLLTMPLDFWWSIRRTVNFIKPSLYLLVETDIWPGLIMQLKKRGIKTVLINGRISPRTFASYRRFRPFTRVILNSVELFLMQSDLDRNRLLEIGIGEDKVKTVGNIKFDRNWIPMGEKERKQWLDILDLDPENDIWVAGSTHQEEESILLDVFRRLRTFFPTLRLIIAPRDVERAKDINRLVLDKGFKAVLKTELPLNGKPYDVLILDTIGELERIYGIAQTSFVGGSLAPIGGHNLLEPASFGKPVLFGPYTHNFVLMSRLLVEAGGGRQVKDAEELFWAMKELLTNPESSDDMGRHAKEFVELSRGALDRVMEYIEDFLDSKK